MNEKQTAQPHIFFLKKKGQFKAYCQRDVSYLLASEIQTDLIYLFTHFFASSEWFHIIIYLITFSCSGSVRILLNEVIHGACERVEGKFLFKKKKKSGQGMLVSKQTSESEKFIVRDMLVENCLQPAAQFSNESKERKQLPLVTLGLM